MRLSQAAVHWPLFCCLFPKVRGLPLEREESGNERNMTKERLKDRYPDEIVATKPRRKRKPRSKRKKCRRPGKGELLTQVELAAVLGENPRTIRKWRLKGLIPTLVLGHRTLRFRLDEVLTALSKRQAKPRKFWEVSV
jgi:hypothetical protein